MHACVRDAQRAGCNERERRRLVYTFVFFIYNFLVLCLRFVILSVRAIKVGRVGYHVQDLERVQTKITLSSVELAA